MHRKAYNYPVLSVHEYRLRKAILFIQYTVLYEKKISK
jgi:hypothetical protein